MKNILSNRKRFLLTTSLLIILLCSGSSFGQSDYLAGINTILNNWVDRLQQGNIGTRRGTNITNNLKQGESRIYTTTLDAGTTYNFLGVCDKDCSDMDIIVLNSSNQEVNSDIKADAIPVVKVTPAETGEYKLQIKMVACRTSLCYYGFAIIQKSEGDRLREQIKFQLDKQASTASGSGLSRTHDYIIDSINKEPNKHSKYFDLSRGSLYLFAGVCDEDCTDLDIKVFDPSGKEVAADSTSDSLPTLIVKPTVTGTYRVEIIMYKCGRFPCFYGIGVFGK